METVIFHVDLDAFYASVEQQDNPLYRGKPVIVGGQGKRGVVSACSYEARAFGVRSAMPMYEARQRCPHAYFVQGRMERYSQVSKQVMEILSHYSPHIQQISIDEAFIDMTGTERLFGKARQAACTIKKAIKDSTALTISIGIGASRFIAKMASDYGKPDGLCRVSKGREIEFIDAIGLKRIWGIGKSTLEQLSKRSITTTQTVRQCSLYYLKREFGEASGDYLYLSCRGIDPGICPLEPKSKSISTERTFSSDISEEELLSTHLLSMSHEVMFRSLAEDVSGKTIALKIRYSDFTTIGVQQSIMTHIYSAEQIHKIGYDLLMSKWDKRQPIRLLGIGLQNLSDNQTLRQIELFEDAYQKKRDVEMAILHLKSKGCDVTKASLLETKKPQET